MKLKARVDKRPKDMRRSRAPRRLLVPVDFSDSSLRALRHAIDLAADSGGSLTIVHVVAADYGWLDIGREQSPKRPQARPAVIHLKRES